MNNFICKYNKIFIYYIMSIESRPTFVYWNLPGSSTAKYVELDKDYPPNNPNTKITSGYSELGTTIFYKDVELKDAAGFINYTDNVLTSTLLNNIPNYIFNMTQCFNFTDGIIQTIGSGIEVVEDFNKIETWINPILFTIVGGVGAYFGKSGWVLRELDQSNDRPIKNLNKWSVFLNETNVINNANPSGIVLDGADVSDGAGAGFATRGVDVATGGSLTGAPRGVNAVSPNGNGDIVNNADLVAASTVTDL